MGRRLVIRADAGTGIGIGHVMRCIAVALAWRKSGGEAAFLGHCLNQRIRRRLYEEGFSLVQLEKPHPHPEDIQLTIDYLVRKKADWCVLDGYHFDPGYQSALRKVACRLIVLDDYNHQTQYHGDILLNQNINAERIQYIADPDTAFLLGLKYVLLRPEFLARGNSVPKISRRGRKIMVTLGGADPKNVMLKVLEALSMVKVDDLEVKVVVGPDNPDVEKLESKCAEYQQPSFSLLRDADMPEIMAWADIALSAGGSTAWELLFMGVPTILMVLADNQQGIAEGLHEKGAALSLGRPDLIETREVAEVIRSLYLDVERRREMSLKGRMLVDGNGAKRLVKVMRGMSK